MRTVNTRPLWPNNAPQTEQLVYVDAPHLCAGLVVRGGIVVEAAPIFRWAIGRTWMSVFYYFVKKRYAVRVM